MTFESDLIPSFMVRDCVVCPKPLLLIFNLVLSTSTFPEETSEEIFSRDIKRAAVLMQLQKLVTLISIF